MSAKACSQCFYFGHKIQDLSDPNTYQYAHHIRNRQQLQKRLDQIHGKQGGTETRTICWKGKCQGKVPQTGT